MPTKLYKVSRLILKDKSVTDAAQIVAGVISGVCKVYKQGATVTTAGPTTIVTNTVVAVRDSGRIVVGDTVQKGTSGTNTATVTEVTSRTSIKLTAVLGTLTVSIGDRLVVNTARPTLYSESSGSVSTGSSDANSIASGLVEFYTTEPIIDLIYSGSGITTSGEYDVQGGYMEPALDIRAYGNDLALAVAALPSTGGAIYIPDGVTVSIAAAVAINKVNVRIFSDSWGSAIIQASAVNPTWHMFNVTSSGLICENLRIDARGTTAAAYDIMRISGLDAGVQPVTIRNCYFLNWRRNAIRITGFVYNVTVDTSWISGGFGPAVLSQQSTATSDPVQGTLGIGTPTHLRLLNTEFTGISTAVSEAAIRLSTAPNVIIHNCIMESILGGTDAASANCIHATGSASIRIVESHFELSTGAPYQPALRPEQMIFLETCSGVQLDNNSLWGGSDTTRQPKKWVTAATTTRGRAINNRTELIWDNVAGRKAIWCDGNSTGWVVVPGIAGANDTDVLDSPYLYLSNYGVGLPIFATDADRATNARAVNGTLIYVTTPTTPANKLQIYAAGAWTGITGT